MPADTPHEHHDPITPEKAWYQYDIEETLRHLNSQPEGLSEQEATARLAKFGPNALPENAGKSAFIRFIAHFKDVLIYILLAAAFLKAVMGHWIDTVVILGVAVINALIGFIQENSAEKSLKGIRNMLSSQAIVVRDGINHTVNAEDLNSCSE